METYLVSFGSDYKRQAHPVLGFKPELGENAVLSLQAETSYAARLKVFELIGEQWCGLYGPESPPGWDYEVLTTLEDAVANPGPKEWVCGVQVIVGMDGSLELRLDDLDTELGEEQAPADLRRDIDHAMLRNHYRVVAFPTNAGMGRNGKGPRKVCLCGAPVEVWYEPGADEDNVPRSECLNRSCELSST